MRAIVALAVLAPALLAGCAATPGTGPGNRVEASGPEAPWWPVGAYWDITFQRVDEPVRTVRMVNFLNASDHFWLGVADRDEALDHALHDTNPFLGRVHWGLLAPHEGNRHAMMYKFPLEHGETWTSGNPFFGKVWNLRMTDGPGWRIVGAGQDGGSIRYDYDPDTRWFRELEVRDATGEVTLRAEVEDHGTGERGTYWFLRGRDYYEGPRGSGTHDETFEVKEEERPVASLAVEFDLGFAGPMRVDVVDPSGRIRHTETFTGGTVSKVVEIPDPARGTWTMRYVGQGNPQGRVAAVGILEYTGAP